MLERRSILRSLAALPLATLPAVAASPTSDVVPALYAEKLRVCDLINSWPDATDSEADVLMDRWGACDRAAVEAPASTLAGAIASIEWAKTELLEFGFQADITNSGKGENFVLALLNGALGALQGLGTVPGMRGDAHV